MHRFNPILKEGDHVGQYAITGGVEGKRRLGVLAEVMLPTTTRLLRHAGLALGMNCLDVGCGGGHVCLLMAEMVGPSGTVVGTDIDAEILELARQDAQDLGYKNVEFRVCDATVCTDPEAYDLVYARFVLTHLSDPQKCLDAMVQSCRPSGVIVIEDIEFLASFCYPPNPAYDRYVELYQQTVLKRGGDPNIGPKLPEMLRKAGIDGVEINVFQPTHLRGEGKRMAAITMDRIAGAVISEGLASRAEVEGIVEQLEKAASDPEVVMSLPRMFQTWGVKA